MHWLKILALAGITLNVIGTVLLWRSSPSGYALTGYMNQELIKYELRAKYQTCRK
jgi:hypothetical protein